MDILNLLSLSSPYFGGTFTPPPPIVTPDIINLVFYSETVINLTFDNQP